MVDHVTANRDFWNADADNWVELGQRLWARETPVWGVWSIPDAKAPLLPAEMIGMSAVELGCGTAYVSGWMARRGARVTAIDVSANQLATAKRLAAQHKATITFIEGNAETTGLPDAGFDFAVSEYGAAIWCEPEKWLTEAHRILKPHGTLSFLGNHPLARITAPLNGAMCDRTLHRPYKGLGRIDWSDVEIEPGGVDFNLTFADWLALFRKIGFTVTDYRELYAPDDMTEDRFPVTAEWAKDYPAEQVWWLEKSNPAT